MPIRIMGSIAGQSVLVESAIPDAVPGMHAVGRTLQIHVAPIRLTADDGHVPHTTIKAGLPAFCAPPDDEPGCACCCEKPGGSLDEGFIPTLIATFRDSSYLDDDDLPKDNEDYMFVRRMENRTTDELKDKLKELESTEKSLRESFEALAKANPNDYEHWLYNRDESDMKNKEFDGIYNYWGWVARRIWVIEQIFKDRGLDPVLGAPVRESDFGDEVPIREETDVGVPLDCVKNQPFLKLFGRGIGSFGVIADTFIELYRCKYRGKNIEPLHCFLNMRDNSGVYWFVEAGPASNPNSDKVEASRSAGSQGINGAEIFFDQSGVDIGEAVEKIKAAALPGNGLIENTLAGKWFYDATDGPNSNTFIAEVLRRAGFAVEAPPCAPAWAHYSPWLKRTR